MSTPFVDLKPLIDADAATSAALNAEQSARISGDQSLAGGLNDVITALAGKQPAGSYATLVSGKVPADQLPSYVDDVLEFANLAALPVTGETGKIYVALDTRRAYRWTGSQYLEISPSEVTSVAGKTGAVTLGTADITGLQDALDNKIPWGTGLGGGQVPFADGALSLRNIEDSGEIALQFSTENTPGQTWTVAQPHKLREALSATPVLEIGPDLVLQSDTTLPSARNIWRSVANYNAQSYIITLPTTGNEPGDILILSAGTLQGTQTVRRENTSGAPFTNLVTLTAGAKYTFRNRTGEKSGWELLTLDTHTHPITQVDGLQSALNDKASVAALAGKASTTHKSTHAIGGSDALTPADIGAAPAGNYLTPTTLPTEYFSRTGDATSRPPTGGQAPHQVVLSNDTRLINARRISWSQPPTSPFIPAPIPAANLISGQQYDIAFVGTTDWAAIGFPSITKTGNAASGSTTLVVNWPAFGIANGMLVSGTGIQPGTTVTGGVSTTLTISLPTTQEITNGTVLFYNPPSTGSPFTKNSTPGSGTGTATPVFVDTSTLPEVGTMAYDGSFLYIVVSAPGSQSLRWARTPLSMTW